MTDRRLKTTAAATSAPQASEARVKTSEIPALSCPFPVTPSHPRTEALTLGCLEWARARELLPDESERTLSKVQSYSALAARCYPSAPFERLAAICDYYSWLFFFDDVCEELSLDGAAPETVFALLTDIYGVLRGKPTEGAQPRFAAALADIWARIAPACPLFWQERLLLHVDDYIQGCVWEAQNRSLGRVPSRAVFETMRMHTSTMYEFWDFIEYAGDFFLPDHVIHEPFVAELLRTGNAVASFANDIYSLRKETENRDIHNLVIVLEHEAKLDRASASLRARVIHDAQVRHFLELERRLPSFDAETDGKLTRYVQGIRTWLRANYDWSCVTPRYNLDEARAS